MANKLVGENYVTPDLVAKVTGQAKYAEDFRVDGMLFCKLLLSPLPHGRVKSIDASKALAMPGVKGILTADELPAPADIVTDLGQRIPANTKGEKALTNEPVYQGEPVLAIAAVDELTAANAIELDRDRMGAPAVCRRSAGEPAAPAGRTRGSKATSGDGRSRARPDSHRRRRRSKS